MKKMMMIAVLTLAQLSYAGEVRRMSTAEASARVEKSATYKDIVKAREDGRDITSDAKLMERISKMLDLSLRDLVSLSSTESNNLLRLINVNAKDVLTEVARLSSIAKDSTTSAQEKEMAKKSLELIAKSAHTVESLAINSEQAKKQQEAVTRIIELSSKISALDFGQASKSFVEKYEKSLIEGKSIEESVRIASNGKFTEKELRDCE